MSKTRKILATLTMVAVTTTASLTAVSSAQAHTTMVIHPHPHFIFPSPTPPPPPPHHHGGLKPGEAALLGAVGGVLVGTIIANSANKQQVQPAPAAGLPAAHYAYCDGKYKTYVIATNTYTGYDMQPHYCNSPWSY